MKNYYVKLFIPIFILLGSIPSVSQITNEVDNRMKVISPSFSDCFSAEVTFQQNGNGYSDYINLDCDNSIIELDYNIHFNNDKCSEWYDWKDIVCDFRVSLNFGAFSILKLKQIPKDGYVTGSTSFKLNKIPKDVIFDGINHITVKLVCFIDGIHYEHDINQIEFPLIGINSGDIYTVEEPLMAQLGEVECVGDNRLRLCNCGTGTEDIIHIRNEYKVQVTNTASQNGSISIGISTNTDKAFTASASYSREFSSSTAKSQSTLIRAESTFNSSKLPEGECATPGFRLWWQQVLIHEYIADCDDVPDVEIIANNGEIPHYSRVTDDTPVSDWCKIDPTCPPAEMEIMNEGDYFSSSECKSILVAWHPEDTRIISYKWTFPDGSTKNQKAIVAHDIGKYKLEAIDNCCNVINKEYNLCDDIIPVTDEWYYNDETGQFCKDFTCQCGDITSNHVSKSREEVIISECVESDNIESIYENGNCIDKHYYQGELLGIVATLTEINIEYDNESGICSKVVICNSDSDNPVLNEVKLATYGNVWTYNAGNKTCSRVVFCFNEEMQEKDIIEADVEYNFNLQTSQCEPSVLCNFQQVNQNPFYPINPGFWSWSEFNGCEKTVLCAINSSLIDVDGNESFYDWEINNNQCKAKVKCENIPMYGLTHTEFPTSMGSWTYNTSYPFNQQCKRIVYCSGIQVIDYAAPTFQPKFCPPCNSGGTQTASYTYCGTQKVDEDDCIKPEDCLGSDQNNSSNARISEYTQDQIISNELLVFPNPAQNKIYLTAKFNVNGLIGVFYNKIGEKVYSTNIVQNSMLISNKVPSGIYFLKITDRNGLTHNTKVVVQQL